MNDRYREQHKLRLAYMPWLYDALKPTQRDWARAWQAEVQAALMALETVEIGPDVFIAPQARIFAEPGRTVRIGEGARIAADCVLHGPLTIGPHVSVNHHVTMDGGRAGIHIGANTRIAAYATLYAFNHGLAAAQLIREQPVTSRGITVGQDVWIGAQAGIVDGVSIGDGAVIGMNAQVTRNVDPMTVVAGNPALVIKQRR
ncbi:MAG: acyltransferase [Pseudomonadales bacterium]|nr:acyltransferase [Pseudomonadales bacterium]MCP5185300.1 acyltransferase [Pseudomonadales bacterium]